MIGHSVPIERVRRIAELSAEVGECIGILAVTDATRYPFAAGLTDEQLAATRREVAAIESRKRRALADLAAIGWPSRVEQ